jgi:signal transduction histidine kinase
MAFVDGLQQTMQLECACLALPQHSDQPLRESNFSNCSASLGRIHVLAETSPLFGSFPDPLTPVEPPVLRKQLQLSSLSKQEAGLLGCPVSRLWVPLRSGGSIQGILSLGPKRGARQFSGQDRQILDLIARYMSMAIQNSYLIADLRTMAQEHAQLHQRTIKAGEAERKRLARELHNQSIQALSGLNYQLSSLKRGLGSQTQPQVEQLQGEVQAIISGLRAIVAHLRLPSLDSMGLTPIVQADIQSLNGKAPFHIALNVEGNEPEDLNEELALCIYQALQEAVANVQKHAQARSVQVGLRFHTEGVALTVEDDSRGFLPPVRLGKFVQAGHFGLMGLQERAANLHGRLTILSSPGQGCTLTLDIPYAPLPTPDPGQPEQLGPKE